MCNLKICYGCYLNLYFSFYDKLIFFLYNFISMSGARMRSKSILPLGFGGGGNGESEAGVG